MQAFLPLLGTDLTLKGKPGKIFNMSSIYGSYTLPFSVSPTSASLHAEGALAPSQMAMSWHCLWPSDPYADETLQFCASMLLKGSDLLELWWCRTQSAYSASKAGLNAMSEGLRRELKPFGVDVVIIAPGVFRLLRSTTA